MKLKTVRVRRSRPSALALALALMLTMLCVYIVSLSSPKEIRQASAQSTGSAQVQLPALEVTFHCEGRYDARLEAQIAAARCVQAGGAGLILAEGDQYAVISHAGGEDSENSFRRSAPGLTLQLQGTSGDVQAVSDAVAFLQALQGETGALAGALEKGNTNAAAIVSLMQMYHAQGRQAQQGLIAIEEGSVVVNALLDQVEDALVQLECICAQPTTARLRHLHAAACANWISLLEDLKEAAGQASA